VGLFGPAPGAFAPSKGEHVMKRLIASLAVLGLVAAPAMAVTKSTTAPTAKQTAKAAAKAQKKSAKLAAKSEKAKPAAKTN